MDDILNLLNKVWKSLKSYYLEESIVQQVVTELLKLIGVTSFNDLLMRRNFSSWKRGTFSFPVFRYCILLPLLITSVPSDANSV
jgi:myosin heavy subunit